MIRFFRVVATVCLGMGLIMFLGSPQAEAQRQPSFGDPLPGLSATEFEEFLLGRDDFLEVEKADQGGWIVCCINNYFDVGISRRVER